MIIELAVVGGVVYRLLKGRKKKLMDYLSPQEAAPTGLQNLRHRYLTPFIGDSRQAHHVALRGEAAKQMSMAERRARRDVLISTGSFGFAILGVLINPFFYVLSTLPIIYYVIDYTDMAYYDLTVKGKVSINAISVFFFGFALVGGFYFELALAMWFFSLIGYVTVKTEDHSKRGLANLFGEQPRVVWVWVDGIEVEIAFEALQMGDTIVIHAGQMIPIDGIITQGKASIDQHMLTGEAQPVEKTVDDFVFNSTIVLSGLLYIEVEHTGVNTIAAQVGTILNQTTDFRKVLQSRAQDVIDKVTLPTVALASVTGVLLGLPQALGVLMVYPGYRLLFLNPLSMLSHLHIASQHGVLIKDGRSLELLNEVDTVVFDKTGTLTLKQPRLKQVYSCSDFSEMEILQFAATAEVKQSHPIAQAILEEAYRHRLTVSAIEDAAYKVGFGIEVKLDGHTIRVGSHRFMHQESIDIPLAIQKEQARCHEYGHSLVMVALDGALIGAVELEPALRPEAVAVINELKARGLKMVIISGDHEAPTRHLAERLGIERYFAEVLPEEKADLVDSLEAQGHRVCFVGDGINDAIALKKATTSVSLCGATTIATDTAQAVLMDGNLNELGLLFDLAGSYQQSIQVNFLATVIPSAVYVGGAYLFGWGFLMAILVQQTSALALVNVVRPLLNEVNGGVDHLSVLDENKQRLGEIR